MKAQVRLAVEKDAEKFVDFVLTTPKNLFDPGIAKYPSLRTLAVDINGEPSVFIPFHPVFMVESIAHKKDISPRENVYALSKFQNTLEELAKVYGIAEIYWLCADKSLIDIAQRYDYEVVQVPVLRKKLKLEQPK